MTCDGCKQAVDARACWIVVGDDRTYFVCAPHCLFDLAREMLKNEVGAESDLLEATALDLCSALDGLSPDSSAERWIYMADCWERLGIVLGALAPRSPAEVLGAKEDQP